MSDTSKPGIDFKTILASAAHDMKNSLSMLLSTLDELATNSLCPSCNSNGDFSKLSYEAKRVNNNLVQLLTLFRLDQDQYDTNIDHHSVYDFLEDQLLNYHSVFEINNILSTLECDENLTGFFDKELLSGVLNNVINNTVRYTHTKLTISALMDADGYLVINVEDDGKGYPSSMLEEQSFAPGKLNLGTGNTGLGLYFSSMVAKAHLNKGRSGYIKISNDSRYEGGGKFTIYLP